MKSFLSVVVCTIFWTFPFFSSAQSTLDTSNLLENIVIKDNRLQMKFSDVSRSIEIISRKQIESAPVLSVAELLNYVAGVDVRQRGVHGIQPDVTIRGGTFDQVLILVNGTKLTDPQTGHHALNLPFDIENVERIEILKGPAARIYGQNAFSGAINIVTRTHTEGFNSGSVWAGDFGLWGAKHNMALPLKNVTQNISLSYQQSNGYRANSDYKIGNVFYQSQVNLGKNKLNFLGGYTERRFGASGFYNTTNTSNEREFIQTNFVAADMPLAVGQWRVTPRLSWRRNQDEYYFNYSTEATRLATRNFTLTQVLSAEVNAAYDSRLGTTGVSVEYNNAQFFNKRLGDHGRTLVSAFLEQHFRLWNGRLDVTPGVMLTNYSDFGFQAFPGVDLGFRATEQLKFFANYGKTYRVPTFTDLYFFNAANNNNPNLLPESANAYEIGAKFNNGFVSFQAAFFQRNGRDLIDRTRNSDSASVRWTPTNLNALLLRGIDASVSLRWKSARFDVSYLNAFDYEFTKVEKFSRYALDFLTSQVSVSVESPIWKNLRYNLRLRNCKRLGQPSDYTVVDAKLMWNASKWGVFAQASNLFDKQYAEQNNIPMPQRWFSVGLNYKFMH